MDEILKEEIREYKETLTCPSCKVITFKFSLQGQISTFSLFSGKTKGCHFDKMLPRLLLWLPANALRDQVDISKNIGWPEDLSPRKMTNERLLCITGRESVQSVTLHLGLQTITGAFDSINHLKIFSVWFGKKIKATSKSCGTICSPQALPFMSDNNVKQKNRFSTLKCSSTEEFTVSCSFCIFQCQQNLWKTCRALPALPRG